MSSRRQGKIVRLAGQQPQRGAAKGPSAISDPYNQRNVPSPRAAGIAYPEPMLPQQRGSARKGAPDLTTQVAPPPQIERYPIIVGRNLTFETVSSRFRLALSGYRQLYVDMLNELIERDTHAYAVVAKRAAMIANAKYSFTPANPADAETAAEMGNSTKQDRAKQIAEECAADWARIPRIKQHLLTLAWADYYGIMGTELVWEPDARTGRWRVVDMVMIHSRRLSFPDPWRWDLYVWDQGAVIGSPDGAAKLPEGIFGWRVADYPGKFLVHSPQLRADYPTREGLGRELAYWMVLKHVAMRAAPSYLERFSDPPSDITWSTGKEDGRHRVASNEDRAKADAAARAGALRGFVHPDSIKWEIKAPDGAGGRSKVTFVEWAKFCNDEMTKAVLGSTLGTDVASSGSRALGDTQRKDTLALVQLSAEMIADSIDDSYVRTWCEINYPGEDDLWPHAQATIEDDPDPNTLVDRAVRLVNVGMPIDADKLADLVGMPLVGVDDVDARVLKPVKQTEPTETPIAPRTGENNAERQAELEQQAADERAQMLQQLQGANERADDAEDDADAGGLKGPPPKREILPELDEADDEGDE
jgi:phage gp29-like protein